ncbi:MAG: hypothetical protein ACREL5_04610 [Gemmatimonadales bacterium]
MSSPGRAPRMVDPIDASRSAHIQQAARDIENGSIGETLASGLAVILGIIGIIGLFPGVADSIAGISAGLAVIIGSGALARRADRLIGERTGAHREVRGGLNLTVFAGAAGAILGILALLGVSRYALLSVIPIVFGGGLLIASVVMARFEQLLRIERGSDAVFLASGAEALVGSAAVILGILALIGIAPLTLSLVGMIAIGAVLLLSGSSLASQLMSFGH